MIGGARLHPTARAWLRGCGAKETGACLGRDPLARPLPVLSAFGHAVVEHGVGKKNSRADMRGPAGAGRRAGVGDVRLTHGVKWQRQLPKAAGRAGDALGRELGCCARVGAGLLLRMRGPAERRCEGLGRLGWLA